MQPPICGAACRPPRKRPAGISPTRQGTRRRSSTLQCTLCSASPDRGQTARANTPASAGAKARTLLEATIECLLQDGEVCAELDKQWTALIDRDAALEQAAE
jgi:hypothetical protein